MLKNVSIDQKLKKVQSHLKKEEFHKAKILYLDILKKFPKNIRAQKGLEALKKNSRNPPKQQVDQLTIYLNEKNFF